MSLYGGWVYDNFGLSADVGYTGNYNKVEQDTERPMRTIKEELFWLHEWRSLEHLAHALSGWIELFNTTYLHSTPGWKAPQCVHQQAGKNRKDTPLKAA